MINLEKTILYYIRHDNNFLGLWNCSLSSVKFGGNIFDRNWMKKWKVKYKIIGNKVLVGFNINRVNNL